jgi:RNA polymerase sigma-70 factor, ECF subfamily
VLCHLDAAYNLARWMMGQESDARDVVQIAALRAFSYIDSLRGDDGKAWLLGIVRNCCLSALRERSQQQAWLDVDALGDESDVLSDDSSSPHALLERKADRAMVNAALSRLAPAFREVLILREMEEMSYEAIAAVVGVPMGTVMSRLSRARRQFRAEIERRWGKEGA